ncbi:hypothetical protein HPB51_014018 [Rhipicephalus microplus]|uniref:Uncharacterized protein n=1 Tax=Rhipicephalus microplus TaxID=6941 RepID=A0A9J6DA81_RHIMP|nr:hypothetical protein HPB51_014018 [Rhipicephalus microplus]
MRDCGLRTLRPPMVGRGYCPRPVASTRCRGSARPEKPVAEVASAGVSPRGCSRLLANAIVAGSPPRRRAAGGHGGRHMYGGLPLFRALATWPGPLPKFGGWAQFQTGSDPRGVAATPGVPTRKLPAAQSQQACVVDPLDPRQVAAAFRRHGEQRVHHHHHQQHRCAVGQHTAGDSPPAGEPPLSR